MGYIHLYFSSHLMHCSLVIVVRKTIRGSVYNRDLKTDHLNTRNIWIPNFLKFVFQMVRYSNGRSIGHVLCTRPTIKIPDQYIRKPGGIYFSSIQIVGLSSIQMAFENRRPFGIQPLFDHSNTERVWYSDPHCIFMLLLCVHWDLDRYSLLLPLSSEPDKALILSID